MKRHLRTPKFLVWLLVLYGVSYQTTQAQDTYLQTINVAYISVTADYQQGVQTVQNTYQIASSGTSAAQLQVNLQAFYLPPNFTLRNATTLVQQLALFSVDLIVGPNNWLLGTLAQANNIQDLLLFSYPNMTMATTLLSDFIFGFYNQAQISPANQFYSLYQEFQNYAAENPYLYNYYPSYWTLGPYENYYPEDYTPYPVNFPNFTSGTVVTYNPYLAGNIITGSLNVTIIVDASLPNEMYGSFFEAITTSTISKLSSFNVYYLTIPIGATQEKLGTYVLDLQNQLGPRFVYATQSVAINLINAITQLSAFSISRYQPIYQWHFFNLTGGNASNPIFDNQVCAPYIYHWEFYNLGTYAQNCQQAINCTSCGNIYDRMLDCDFGYALGYAMNGFANLLSQNNPNCSSPADCTEVKQSLLAQALASTSNYNYTTGPLSFDSSGNRIGTAINIYLGVNTQNSQLVSSCTAVSGNWSCNTNNFTFGSTASAPQKILIAAYNSPPYYYLNHTTGQYDGFYVALAKLFAQEIGFSDYTVYGVSAIGRYNSTSGSWNGVIGEVLGPADIGMAPLQTISNLTQSIAFSNQYLQVPISVLQQITLSSTSLGETFTIMFSPFSYSNWLLMFGGIVFTAIILTVLDRISPNMISFNLNRSWFYIMARSVYGAGGQNPDMFSAQILMLFWSFVTMITISTYYANLTALTIDRAQSSQYATSFPDLLTGQWQPCYVANSFVSTYFSTTTSKMETAVWKAMQGCVFNSESEAFNTMKNMSNPAAARYALVILQPSATYAASLSPYLVVSVNYSILNLALIVPNGLQARLSVSTLNSAIQNLSLTNSLSSITNAYLLRTNAPLPKSAINHVADFFMEDTSATEFNIATLSGIFIIIGLAILATLVFAGFERGVLILWRAYSGRKRQKFAQDLLDISGLPPLHTPSYLNRESQPDEEGEESRGITWLESEA